VPGCQAAQSARAPALFSVQFCVKKSGSRAVARINFVQLKRRYGINRSMTFSAPNAALSAIGRSEWKTEKKIHFKMSSVV